MSELRQAKWTIERVELVLFNLEHKRWQIWQEHSSTQGQSDTGTSQLFSARLFRGQVIQFLATLRPILEKLCADSSGGGGPFNAERYQADVTLAFDEWPPIDPLSWESFFKYCEDTCDRYGISSVNLRHFLRGPNEGALKDLNREDVLDFISILPIPANWDLFGCWYRLWAGEEPRVADAFPWRSHTASLWNEPFYMAQITPDLVLTPRGPLSKAFRTEVISADLSPSIAVPISYPPAEFFDSLYADVPRDKEEVAAYKAYAHIYDNLQRALKFDSSYLISYPIELYDHIHFLQIQVQSLDKDSVAPLKDLWDAWMKWIHPRFWIFELKQFLNEELQRICLSYFQAKAADSLKAILQQEPLAALYRAALRISPSDWDLADLALVQSLHVVLPIQRIDLGESGRFAYEPYSYSDSSNHSRGRVWKEIRGHRPSEKPTVTIGNMKIWATENRSDLISHATIEGRVKQLVSQERQRLFDLCGPLRAFVQDQKKDDRRQLESLVARYGAGCGSFQELASRLGADTRTTLTRLMTSVFGSEDPSPLEDVFFVRRLPLVISEALNVGALKWCTHAAKQGYEWRGTWKELIEDLAHRSQLLTDLKGRLGASLDDIQGALLENALAAVTIYTEWASAFEPAEQVPAFGLTLPACHYKILRWEANDDLFLDNDVSLKSALKWEPQFGLKTSAKAAGKTISCAISNSFVPCWPLQHVTKIADFFKLLQCDGAIRIGAFAVPFVARDDAGKPFAATETMAWRNAFYVRYTQVAHEPMAESIISSHPVSVFKGYSDVYGWLFVGTKNGWSAFSASANDEPNVESIVMHLKQVVSAHSKNDHRHLEQLDLSSASKDVVVLFLFDTWKERT
jgi:hypothetical protein